MTHAHTPIRHSRRRRLAISAVNVIAPPVAARFHARYEQRSWLLFLDTLLSLLILFLLGAIILLLTSRASLTQPASATLTAPHEAVSGEVATLVLALSADSAPLENIRVSAVLPDNFFVDTTSPTVPSSQETIWTWQRIERGATESVTIEGRLVATPATEVDFRGMVEYTIGGLRYAKSLAGTTRITSSPLVAELTVPVSASTNAAYVATARVVNTGSAPMTNLRLTLKLPSDSTASPAPTDADGWYIAELQPKEEYIVGISVTASQPGTEEISLDVFARGQTTWWPQTANITKRVLVSASSIDDLSDDPGTDTLSFVAEARYTNSAGIQLGYGPLPPRVGERTGYRLFWVLRPDDTYANIIVTAKIPPGTEWGGHDAANFGQGLTYDASTRTVRWELGEVRASDGLLSASFDVTVTPSAGDVGKILTLLRPSLLTAESAGGRRTKTSAAVTTDLLSTSTSDAVVR